MTEVIVYHGKELDEMKEVQQKILNILPDDIVKSMAILEQLLEFVKQESGMKFELLKTNIKGGENHVDDIN